MSLFNKLAWPCVRVAFLMKLQAFLYPLDYSENLGFSDVYREDRKASNFIKAETLAQMTATLLKRDPNTDVFL